MGVNLNEEWFAATVAEDLLWHAENAEGPKLRAACRRAAFYYMTFDQVAQYLGSTEAAEEVFNDQ
jgi:hypothetical protein